MHNGGGDGDNDDNIEHDFQNNETYFDNTNV
jgi:hypothetical protein